MVTGFPSPRPIRGIAALCVCLFAMILAAVTARAAEVTATLDRESVPAGQGAQLTIEISGGKAPRPEVPAVPDFVVNPHGQSSSFQMINGETTSSYTYTYAVGSHKPGDYTIPSFGIMVEGVELRTPELKLTVLAAGQTPPPPAPQNPASPSTPPSRDSPDSRLGTLTVEFLDSGRGGKAWVGEIVPVRIRAAFPEDVRLQRIGALQPEGAAFTLHNLSEKPEQKVAAIDGKRHLTITWLGGISATKAGSHVPEITLHTVIAFPERGRQDAGRDPVFDSFFARMVQREVNLSSKDADGAAMEIQALPEEGKPAGFSGAVGKFRLDAVGMPAKWTSGEPAEITATVEGQGNFALLAQPEPLPAESWKTYPGKSDFTARDHASFSGSQLFRFNAVPQRKGPQTLSFAVPFFDPESGKYETASYTTKEFEVSGMDVAPPAPVAAGEKPPAPAPPKDPDQLAPQHTADTSVKTLLPPAWRPGYAAVCCAGGGMALLGLGLAARRRVRLDPVRRARAEFDQTMRAALSEVDAMAAGGNAAGFFAAGRRALQTRLGETWGRPPHGISLADVAAELGADSPAAVFFREADRREFSGAAAGGADLTDWRARLLTTLRDLEPVTAHKPKPGPRTAAAVNALIALGFLTLISHTHAADFAGANVDYAAGRFPQAAEAYEAVIRDSGPTAARLYNLGNARYRDGQVGPAILAWERAALLAPRDPDIRSNLAIARRKAALAGENSDRTWGDKILGLRSLREWSFLLAGSCLFTGALILLQGVIGFRRLAAAGAAAGLLVAGLSGAALHFRSPELARAILTGTEPVLRVSPLETADSAGSAATGRTVLLEKRHANWAYVRLPGTSTAGWIPAAQVERIIPE